MHAWVVLGYYLQAAYLERSYGLCKLIAQQYLHWLLRVSSRLYIACRNQEKSTFTDLPRESCTSSRSQPLYLQQWMLVWPAALHAGNYQRWHCITSMHTVLPIRLAHLTS